MDLIDNFKGKQNTNGFDKNPQNIGNGRPKKILTILKEQGYGKDDVITAFNELMFYTISDLKKVYDNKTNPIILRITANQLRLALEKGDMGRMKEILDHVIGKPMQKTDLTTLGKPIFVDPKTYKGISDDLDNEL